MRVRYFTSEKLPKGGLGSAFGDVVNEVFTSLYCINNKKEAG